jgi:Kef-type K+ transport system membrane component KefB
MSYAKKDLKNVTGSIIGVVVAAALAVWQFYLFVTFAGQGGTSHLWWAIVMALVACGAAFMVFSVFVRHDTDDELHITSTRRA